MSLLKIFTHNIVINADFTLIKIIFHKESDNSQHNK
jgi:hypothetical protein